MNILSMSSKKVIKLECIICTDKFDINTKHNCLLRNENQEFTIKFKVRQIFIFILSVILKMANNEIQEKFKLYLELNKEIALFRKKQADQKKIIQNLEDEIKVYMKENQMDSISLNEGEIVLYDRKISQSFKKETIVEKLTEKLKGNGELAESLAESIVTNKVFNIESKIKAKIKKAKE